jgi:hypothetical protein
MSVIGDKLTQKLTADGSTVEFTCGGPFALVLSDDLGGGTVVIEIKIPDGTFIPFPSTEKTDLTGSVIDIPGSNRYRATLSGSTAPSLDIYISADKMDS